VRTWLIHKVKPLEVDVKAIIERLAQEKDVSARMALILTLGEYEAIPAGERGRLAEMLCDLYRDDADPGIHGACQWLLRRWHSMDKLGEIDRVLATGKVEGERRWYLNKQGQTLAVLPGPTEFLMGSPGAEEGRYTWENLHRRLIPRSFAIATKEVTVDQFQAFLRENPTICHIYRRECSPEGSTPQISVQWYKAAAYCRWLSEREEIPEDQMCYPPIDQIKDGLRLPDNYLARTGYRLPTEAEWEYACRAGALTSRCYGQSEELLAQYAWYSDTSDERSWPVGSLKPNDFGLFDMHGNVYEWCQDSYLGYQRGTKGAPREDAEDRRAVTDRVSRVLRGGSFLYNARFVRSAYRYSLQPVNRYYVNGFRVARTYR
jgi:formylglycine-generating enzyme required for sulfatase activity